MDPAQAPDTLCAQCRLIFAQPLSAWSRRAADDDYVHHQSYEELKVAADSKCWICQMLLRHISSTIVGNTPLKGLNLRWWINTRGHSPSTRSLFNEYFLLWFPWKVGDDSGISRFIMSDINGELVGSTPEHTSLDVITSSFDSLYRARNWVEECVDQHFGCGRAFKKPPFVPKRLVHIGADEDSWNLCVYQHPGTSEPASLRYIALSYMWGQHQQLLLQESTIEKFQRGLPISTSLPRTFQDLVHVARALGVEYLWIDALCIVQDSPQDWAAESMCMQDIYANAYCTIAASWGSDPTKGLFTMRDVDTIRCGKIKTAWHDEKSGAPINVRLFEPGGWDRNINESPLHKRGWALQERLLSSRVLYFTKEQILFECDTHVRCEVFQEYAPEYYIPVSRGYRVYTWLSSQLWTKVQSGNDPDERAFSEQLFEAWADTVTLYSQCGLTKRSDKLVAIRGLAELYMRLGGDEYLSGLWRSQIWSSLLWSVDRYLEASNSTSYDDAPSFSWAVVDGPIAWSPFFNGPDTFHPFELIDAKPQCITVRGFAPMHDPYGSTPLHKFLRDKLGIDVVYDDLRSVFSTDDLSHPPWIPMHFLLLSVEEDNNWVNKKYIGRGIAVRPISGINAEKGLACLRVGYFFSHITTQDELAEFGLYADQDGNIKEPDGLEKTVFLLR